MEQDEHRELDRVSDVEETLRRRTAQLEALRQVGLELAAELDLDALLGNIVSHAVELLGGETGGLYLYRPEQDVLEWSIGTGPRLPPIGSTLRPGEGLSGKIWETGQSIIVSDYHHWPGRAGGFDRFPNAAALGALISWGEERLGAINILFDLSRTLTEVEVEILELFATQAAIAIHNARLYEEAQRRADRLAVVNHVARAVGATLNLERLLEAVYEELTPIFVPDAFFIALYDEGTQELEYRFQVDEGVRQPPDRQPVEAGLSSLVISEKKPLIVRDLEQEQSQLPTPLVWGTMKVSASWLGVPMLVGERLIGIISVQAYRAHAYGSEEEMLLSTIADQVAVAIERAQLVQDLEQSLEDLRLTQDRLVQAQKMEAIGRLAGGVAHDFNNLLTAILGYSDLVLHEMDEDSPLRADVQEISKGAERAAALTQQLLAFSRKQMLQLRVFDLNDLVRGVENMLRRLIGEHVELEIALGSAPAKIEADPGQIEQILVNLVVNARDAMLRGGRIRVETKTEILDQAAVASHPDLAPGRHVCLVVSDNGTGMNDEILEHIFEPFFTTKELGKGTGLGLATVHGIVKQSGGDIAVHSRPGEGTIFTVYMPYAEADTDSAAHRAAQNLPRGSEVTLLVEDEDMVRELAHRTLEQQGYEVLSASHPDDALHIVDTSPCTIDLLITDVVMPGMGGRELANRLALAYPDIRVLYISGYTDDAIVHQGVLDPGVAFLQKPFTPLTLARKVRQILDGERHKSVKTVQLR